MDSSASPCGQVSFLVIEKDIRTSVNAIFNKSVRNETNFVELDARQMCFKPLQFCGLDFFVIIGGTVFGKGGD